MGDRGPILVVDDDVDVRTALCETLEVEGYLVAAASDGEEALRWLEEHGPPRLVLLDWNMTPMDGPGFMNALARLPGCAELPVVLLTADAKVEQKVKTNRYVGYLSKPVDLDKLFELVTRYVG